MTDPWEDVRETLKRIEEVRNMGLEANPSKRILTRVLADADALLAVVPKIKSVLDNGSLQDKVKFGMIYGILAALPEHLK